MIGAMIVAYAGRRSASLPDGSEERVQVSLRRLLTELAPSAIVGPAADGGDLLVLEAAAGVPAHVVLPTSREAFREASVEGSWRGRYDRALDMAASVETLDLADGAAAYRAANTRVVERALELRSDERERAVALVIASPGQGAMVEDFIAQATRAGMTVERIDPA